MGSGRVVTGGAEGAHRSTMRAVASAAGVIAVITLVSRVVGFGRWFAFSHSVGATCVGTTYQSVNAVPNVLFEVAAGGVLAAVAVPMVAGALGRGRREDADQTASALLTWSLLVLVPLGLVVLLGAGPIARLLLGSDDTCAGALGLGTELLRVFSIQVPLYGIGIVLAGVLQSHRRFVGATVAPLLSSLVVIATYLVYRSLVENPAAPVPAIPDGAVLVLGVGTTLGVAALSLPLLVPIRRAGIRLRPTLRFPEGASTRVRQLALAGLLALTGQQVATVVVIWLANERGGAGTLNVHTYVQAVSLLPYAVLAVPLATAAFPSLAEEHAAAVRARAVTTLSRTWLATLLVGLLSAGVLVAVARPVQAFFTQLDAGRGDSSGAAALGAMAPTLVAVSPAILALGIIGLLSRALYVRGRARVAGAVVGAGWLGSVVLPLLTLHGVAQPGQTLTTIGAGTSLGLVVAAVGLIVLTARAWGQQALAVPGRPLLAGLMGAVAAGAAGWWLGGVWQPTNLTASLLASVVTGVMALTAFAVVAALVDRSVLQRLRRGRSSVSPGEVVSR